MVTTAEAAASATHECRWAQHHPLTHALLIDAAEVHTDAAAQSLAADYSFYHKQLPANGVVSKIECD